jgi:UDP:flavonoid glycosyltransferase YjiC (YdhE family)
MLALSLALKRAGHDILLAGPPEKAGWARRMGCPFQPLGGDITAFVDGMKDAHSILSSISFINYVREQVSHQFKILPGIIRGADLVVGSSLVFALSSVAEAMTIKYRYIAFTPQLLPSRFHPFPASRRHGLPKQYNIMTWRIARILDRFNFSHLINRQRKNLGLKPVRDIWLNILGNHVIVASDRVIGEVPPDIEFRFTQTGYMHLEQPDVHNAGLEDFLSSGPPPIYAGFGSMPKGDQICNVPIIVRAVRSLGQRVIIANFWNKSSDFSNSDDEFFINKYPHLKLFPRMAAVIHHGGAGTTATCAVSGVPQIIVPHALDQYYWGNQVYRSRLGPRPVWRSKLTSKKIAGALKQCLSDSMMRQNARAASKMINSADSLDMTVNALL